MLTALSFIAIGAPLRIQNTTVDAARVDACATQGHTRWRGYGVNA